MTHKAFWKTVGIDFRNWKIHGNLWRCSYTLGIFSRTFKRMNKMYCIKVMSYFCWGMIYIWTKPFGSTTISIQFCPNDKNASFVRNTLSPKWSNLVLGLNRYGDIFHQDKGAIREQFVKYIKLFFNKSQSMFLNVINVSQIVNRSLL